MTRCGAFEVHLDSSQDHLTPEFHWSLHVDGRVKFVPTLAYGPPPRLRGPLTYVSASGSQPGECFSAEIRRTSPGEIELSDVQLSPYDPERPSAPPVISLKLTVTTPPTETFHLKSTPHQDQCATEEPPDYDQPLWFLTFQSQHLGFTFPGSDFLRDAAPKFALAVYSPNTIQLINGAVTENTLVELIHTPEPPVPLPE